MGYRVKTMRKLTTDALSALKFSAKLARKS
jgi:hypothetical protein